MRMPLILSPLTDIPLIKQGDDIGAIIGSSLESHRIQLQSGDIIVVTEKIISKSEGRLVSLEQISPGQKAIGLAKTCEKDARFVELVLSESKSVLRCRPGTLIVEHKLGFICANAGIDHSNVHGSSGKEEDWYLLLPENPDESCRKIQAYLEKRTSTNLGIMTIDSHGRAWRNGTVGVCIGVSGIPALVDMRGQPDLFGYQLRVTQIAAADELAGSASLVMGQAAEKIPVVHVRGFPYPLRDSSFSELVRPKDLDLFR